MQLFLRVMLLGALVFTQAWASESNDKNEGASMIQGLRTVTYPVADLGEGKEWYSSVLNKQPYFDEPFYVGYEVGGFELGLLPDGEAGQQGAVAYWGVENAEEALERLYSLGARPREPISDVGGGIKVATVLDPFGNVFGIIENPLFKLENVR